MTHPVEPLGLEDVAVDLVELPPTASAPPVYAAVLALALHAGRRRYAREHCNIREGGRRVSHVMMGALIHGHLLKVFFL